MRRGCNEHDEYTCKQCDWSNGWPLRTGDRAPPGISQPEEVELYVVQYRSLDTKEWYTMSIRSRLAADQDESIAREVWNKKTRILKIKGEVVS